MSEYDKERLRHGLDHLFRRFNMFLVSTSFLVVAFVALLTGEKELPMQLRQSIPALGSFLSVFYAVMNYLEAKSLERGTPSTTVKRFRSMAPDMLRFLRNPFTFADVHGSSHTWFLPIVFWAFWVTAWVWAFECQWLVPVSFHAVLLLLLGLYGLFGGRGRDGHALN